MKTIKDARVAPAQVEPIHAHNLQALQEWMEGLELFFPSSFTALEMVVMQFSDSLDVDTLEVRIGTATVGGGTNKRYRTITVTGYSA